LELSFFELFLINTTFLIFAYVADHYFKLYFKLVPLTNSFVLFTGGFALFLYSFVFSQFYGFPENIAYFGYDRVFVLIKE